MNTLPSPARECRAAARWTISPLSAGAHVITVQADDGQGGAATASVTVTVVGDLAEPAAATIFLPLILK